MYVYRLTACTISFTLYYICILVCNICVYVCLCVLGDETRIGQIANNLANNAIKVSIYSIYV